MGKPNNVMWDDRISGANEGTETSKYLRKGNQLRLPSSGERTGNSPNRVRFLGWGCGLATAFGTELQRDRRSGLERTAQRVKPPYTKVKRDLARS